MWPSSLAPDAARGAAGDRATPGTGDAEGPAWALAGPAQIAAARRRRRLRILRARCRRPLLAVVALGLVVAGRASAPRAAPAPEGTRVWVAAHDLPAGRAVSAADLRALTVPAALVPVGAWAEPVPTTLARPVRRGEVLIHDGTTAPDPGRPGAGRVALSFPVPAALAATLRPGDRLRLFAAGSPSPSADPAEADPAAAAPSPGPSPQPGDARVDVVVADLLSTPAAGREGAPAEGSGEAWELLGGPGGGGTAAHDPAASVAVLLGVTPEDAARLATWDPERLVVALDGPGPAPGDGP